MAPKKAKKAVTAAAAAPAPSAAAKAGDEPAPALKRRRTPTTVAGDLSTASTVMKRFAKPNGADAAPAAAAAAAAAAADGDESDDGSKQPANKKVRTESNAKKLTARERAELKKKESASAAPAAAAAMRGDTSGDAAMAAALAAEEEKAAAAEAAQRAADEKVAKELADGADGDGEAEDESDAKSAAKKKPAKAADAKKGKGKGKRGKKAAAAAAAEEDDAPADAAAAAVAPAAAAPAAVAAPPLAKAKSVKASLPQVVPEPEVVEDDKPDAMADDADGEETKPKKKAAAKGKKGKKGKAAAAAAAESSSAAASKKAAEPDIGNEARAAAYARFVADYEKKNGPMPIDDENAAAALKPKKAVKKKKKAKLTMGYDAKPKKKPAASSAAAAAEESDAEDSGDSDEDEEEEADMDEKSLTAYMKRLKSEKQWVYFCSASRTDLDKRERYEKLFLNRIDPSQEFVVKKVTAANARARYRQRMYANYHRYGGFGFGGGFAAAAEPENNKADLEQKSFDAADGLLKMERVPFNDTLRDAICDLDVFPKVLLTIVYDYALDANPLMVQYTQFIDVNKLEHMVRTLNADGKDIKDELDPLTYKLIFAAVREASKDRFNEDITHFLNTHEPTLSSTALEEMPETKRELSALLNVTLWDYQLKTLAWMKQVEHRVANDENGLTVPDDEDMKWKGVRTALRFDHLKNRIKIRPASAKKYPKRELRIRGGVCAEEMGLGKTLVAISLMLVNAAEGPAPSVWYHPYCFATNATLVVCPSHLAQQWASELAKFCATPLKVHLITTKDQHSVVSHQDVIDADVVIVSAQFFQNPNYLKKASGKTTGNRQHTVRAQFARMHTNGDKVLPKKSVQFDHFHWRRLILDEGHELFGALAAKKISVMDCIETIEADTFWYLSGTPFPDCLMAPRGMFKFLRLTLNGKPLMERDPLSDADILKEMKKDLQYREQEAKAVAGAAAEAAAATSALVVDPYMGFGFHNGGMEAIRARELLAEKEAEAEFENEQKGLQTYKFGLGSTTITSTLLSPFGAVLERFLLNQYFCRHTKASVGANYEVPDYIDKKVMLELAPVERSIYARIPKEHKFDMERRQVCCHLQISNDLCGIIGGDEQKSLDVIKDAMTVHYMKRIATAFRQQQQLTQQLAQADQRIANLENNNNNNGWGWGFMGNNTTQRNQMKANEKKNREQIVARLDTARDSAKEALADTYHFQDVERLVADSEATAQYGACANHHCGSIILLQDVVIAFCGHVYCGSCYDIIIRDATTPNCRNCWNVPFNVPTAEFVHLNRKYRHVHPTLTLFGGKGGVHVTSPTAVREAEAKAQEFTPSAEAKKAVMALVAASKYKTAAEKKAAAAALADAKDGGAAMTDSSASSSSSSAASSSSSAAAANGFAMIGGKKVKVSGLDDEHSGLSWDQKHLVPAAALKKKNGAAAAAAAAGGDDASSSSSASAPAFGRAGSFSFATGTRIVPDGSADAGYDTEEVDDFSDEVAMIDRAHASGKPIASSMKKSGKAKPAAAAGSDDDDDSDKKKKKTSGKKISFGKSDKDEKSSAAAMADGDDADDGDDMMIFKSKKKPATAAAASSSSSSTAADAAGPPSMAGRPELRRSFSSLSRSQKQAMIDATLKEQEAAAEKEVAILTRGLSDAGNSDAVLVNQYGSKMCAIIRFLRRACASDSDHRIIIFSQWPRMLGMVGNTLEENGIKVVYCRGNVMRRNKAIKSFYSQDDVRVIMLSMDSAASGTNLTQASHIILVDPVAGSKEEARAVESQAIGRAHRQGQTKRVVVVRFLCSNTIEEELSERNQFS